MLAACGQQGTSNQGSTADSSSVPAQERTTRTASLKNPNATFTVGIHTQSAIQLQNGTPIEEFIIPWWLSRQYADNWDKFLKDKTYRDKVMQNNNACSFLLPASNLQYLVDSLGMEYVTVYLAIDTNDNITLVYDGGNRNPNEPQNDTIYEQPVYEKRGTKYAFDNAMPCPICDKVGLSNK